MNVRISTYHLCGHQYHFSHWIIITNFMKISHFLNNNNYVILYIKSCIIYINISIDIKIIYFIKQKLNFYG